MYGILQSRPKCVCVLAWSAMGGGEDDDRMRLMRWRFRSAKDKEATFPPRIPVEQIHWMTGS